MSNSGQSKWSQIVLFGEIRESQEVEIAEVAWFLLDELFGEVYRSALLSAVLQ